MRIPFFVWDVDIILLNSSVYWNQTFGFMTSITQVKVIFKFFFKNCDSKQKHHFMGYVTMASHNNYVDDTQVTEVGEYQINVTTAP